MKIYLDSQDPYFSYSLNNNNDVVEIKPKYSKNDARIGVISIILLTAFTIYLVSHVFTYAYGVIPEGVNRDANIAKLKEIKKYCSDRVDRIIAGDDPIKDLINAGAIPSDTFQNITCQNIDNEISHAFSYASGESDFYLEGVVDSSNVSNSFNAMGQNTSGLNITKLEFRGDALKSICPSQQCTIQYINESTSPSDPLRSSAYISDYFSEPALDDRAIDYSVHFNIKDAIIDPNVGPKKRQYLEEHHVSQFFCTVNDIIEDNGQEVYYCDGSTLLTREFDSKEWHFDTIGKYDAKRHTYIESGKYTRE